MHKSLWSYGVVLALLVTLCLTAGRQPESDRQIIISDHAKLAANQKLASLRWIDARHVEMVSRPRYANENGMSYVIQPPPGVGGYVLNITEENR